MVFETVTVHLERSVLFVEIAAPPMNLLGPELVRDLVAFIQRAEADDAFQVVVFKSADPDYFISHVDVTRITEYREEAAKRRGRSRTGSIQSRLRQTRTSVATPISSARACATPRRKAGSGPP